LIWVGGEIVDSRPHAVTVRGTIDELPLSSFQISVLILCGLVLVLDGFVSQSIGFLAPPMAETLGIPLGTFGPIFAAGLVGLLIAAMTMGPVADRWGRKWPIVFSVLTFAAFSALTARATSFDQLLFCRFLTGLGLGGALPNVFALTSEYVPERLRSVAVTAVACGMTSGPLLGGLISSVMIPKWGWRSVFYFGGLLSFALSLVLIELLPESVEFLTVRGVAPQKIATIMTRICPELAGTRFNFPVSQDHRRRGLAVKDLFNEGRLVGTILLWVVYFMNLLILYVIVNWLPALLRQAALPVSSGVTAISLFSLGGVVGCLMQGRLMNVFGTYAIMLGEFGLCGLLIGLLAFVVFSLPLVMTVTLLLGCVVQGAQAGLAAIASSFYPTQIRSTGLGWALGVGRIGSIVGPVLVGILLSMAWNPQQILLAGTIPAFCAAAAVMLSSRVQGRASALLSGTSSAPV
jgi:AAHS family 4-hydroxybenzoate transporter-like MFS transporter